MPQENPENETIDQVTLPEQNKIRPLAKISFLLLLGVLLPASTLVLAKVTLLRESRSAQLLTITADSANPTTMPIGSSAVIRFVANNTAGRAVQIVGVHVPCGCTMPLDQFPITVPPETKVLLSFRVTPEMTEPIAFSKDVVVYTDLQGQIPSLPIRIQLLSQTPKSSSKV
jgi:hypothetical protein